LPLSMSIISTTCHHYTSTTSFFFFSCYGAHRDLHSFPTRRSSDLEPARIGRGDVRERDARRVGDRGLDAVRRGEERPAGADDARSEEHTSELQSPYDLVCRLLLEKKKKKNSYLS